MTVIFWSLVFVFAREIKEVHSPDARAIDNDLSRRTSKNLSPQLSSVSSSNPCDATVVRGGASDADVACQSECFALRAELSTIYHAYPDYKTMKYLYSNCGMVTEGKCSTATTDRICWCHTPNALKGQASRRTLSNCRSGIHMMHKFTSTMTYTANDISVKNTKTQTQSHEMNEEAKNFDSVHMQQLPPSHPASGPIPKRPRSNRPRRANTSLRASCCGLGGRSASPDDATPGTSATPSALPSSPHSPQPLPEEADFNTRDDNQPEGSILCTDVRVSGNDVRAILDTGSGMTIIHQRYAGDVVSFQDETGTSADNQKFKIAGTTQINLEIRTGIIIAVRAFVTDLRYGLIIGSDFFVAYKAKINIFDRTMGLIEGRNNVLMSIKFRPSSTTFMMNSHHATYMGVLIAVRLDTYSILMSIDTAASVTIVDKNLLTHQRLRSTTATCSFGRGSAVGFKGETNVNLLIGDANLNVPTLVPHFTPARDFITGNDFNKLYVQQIDYEHRTVTLRIPVAWPFGYKFVTVPAFVVRGE